MTMSTNLGWPSEPDPEPEHRRLGWLARMLGVSRETDTPTNAYTEAQVVTVEFATAAEPQPQPKEEEEIVSASRTDDTPVDPGPVVEDSVVVPASSTSENRSAPGAPTSDLDQAPAVHHRSDDVDREERGAIEHGVDDDRRSGDQGSPAELGDATSEQDELGPVEGRDADGSDTEQDVTAGHGTQHDVDDRTADASGETALAPSGGPARTSPVAVSRSFPTDEQANGGPVDNAVDEAVRGGTSERGNRPYRAGDNVVDESADTLRQLADHADREALVAALPTPGSDTPLARELAENARRRIQLTGRPFPKPVAPRVLTVANQKGGVGKTTTTVNIAAALAQAGLSVLVIDLDPQGNASTALGIDHHAEVPSIYDVLVDGTPMLEVVQPCSTVENLHCAPATIDLAGAEIELVSLVARESRLQKAIAAAVEQGHSYDYILIDCPPSLGLLTVNAMVAASEVFIPIQCEYYALEGLSQLLKNIDLVKRHLNPALHVSTILLTMYDGRTRLSAQVADEVREHFPEQVLRTTVPRSVRVSEAPSFGETVMTYDPASSGALAYLEAAGELADRGAAGDA